MMRNINDEQIAKLKKINPDDYEQAVQFLKDKSEEITFFSLQKAIISLHNARHKLRNNFPVLTSLGNENKLLKEFMKNHISQEELSILASQGLIGPSFFIKAMNLINTNSIRNDNSPEKKALKAYQDGVLSPEELSKLVTYNIIDEDIMSREAALYGISNLKQPSTPTETVLPVKDAQKYIPKKVVSIEPYVQKPNEDISTATILEPKNKMRSFYQNQNNIKKIVDYETKRKKLFQNKDLADALRYTLILTAEQNLIPLISQGKVSEEEIKELIDNHLISGELLEKELSLYNPMPLSM